MHINPTNIREKLAGFPSHLLHQTMAAVTAKIPPSTPNHRPSSANRTKRLAALASRFNQPANHLQSSNPNTTPITETPTRKRPASPDDNTKTPTNHTSNGPITITPATATTTNHNTSNSPYSALADDSDDEEPNPTNNPTATPTKEPTTTPTTPTTPPPDSNLFSSQVDKHDDNQRPPDHLLYRIPSNHFSQDTTHELELLDDYLRSNDPSLLTTFTDQLVDKLASFNDTDAKTIWQFAHDLIQDPNTIFQPEPHNNPNNNPTTDMEIDENPTNSTDPTGGQTNNE